MPAGAESQDRGVVTALGALKLGILVGGGVPEQGVWVARLGLLRSPAGSSYEWGRVIGLWRPVHQLEQTGAPE